MQTKNKSTMKKIFIYCFDKWWRPVLFFLLIVGLVILNSELNIKILKKPIQFLSNFSIVVLLISFCFQLYKKRYLKGFVNLFILFVTVFFTFLMNLVDGDHWADDLKIPKGIQIENPIGSYASERPDSFLKLKKTHLDLVLYNSAQPGMYEFDFWSGKIENGTIYLKAFEITQEEELSFENVKNNSKVQIYNSSDSVVRYSSTRSFKIYEGDWGKYYAARFEVWFIPILGGQERKLFQKNFKIEGWMH